MIAFKLKDFFFLHCKNLFFPLSFNLMDNFDKDSIRTLSALCRIKIEENDLELYKERLERILNYMLQIATVDVSDIDPLSNIQEQDIESIREDLVENRLSRTDFLANCPKHMGGIVVVPTVIK